ncbi:MAG TPA: amidohydrolase [archaeon]|nr:amidohydrolase [archaeon]
MFVRNARSLVMIFFLLRLGGLALAGELDKPVESELPSLVALYKEIHAAPELSYFEKNTSARLAGELRAAGYEVTCTVGNYEAVDQTCYGVVAVIKNGPGPTVLVRTDMDALPIEEKTGADYASKVRMRDIDRQEVSVMHACGHDVHQTILVGTARLLARMKSQWSGTLILIGQPAEERGGGARAMLAGGLYERWPLPDYALAEHVDPTLDAGQVGYCPGWAMANVDMLDITIRGVGAHGARPHQGRDPVVIAAQVINALQTIVSREIDPVDAGVVTVGSIHGGTKHNIIPDEVRLQLTVRSFTDEVRQRILKAIERITVYTARSAGVPEDRLPVISGGVEHTPALYNDPVLTESTAQALVPVLGEQNVVRIRPTTGGEDFSEYGLTPQKVPVFMFRVGTAQPGSDLSTRPGLHSPYYLPLYEPAIRTGVKAMTAAVLNLMGK